MTSSRLESQSSKEMLSPAPARNNNLSNERIKAKHGSNSNLRHASVSELTSELNTIRVIEEEDYMEEQQYL